MVDRDMCPTLRSAGTSMAATEGKSDPTTSMQVRDGVAAPGSKDTKAGLVVLYSGLFERFAPAYPFGKSSLVVGREEDCDIYLPDDAVSRHHATIHYENDQWLLADEGSRNGVYVDGELVAGSILLQDDQVIMIGDTLFKFVGVEAEQYALYRIDGAKWGEPHDVALARHAELLVGGYQVQRVQAQINRAAPSRLAILLQGESGVGKDLAAQRIHQRSRRAGKFWPVNCGGLSTSLLASELFGHAKGAFTGATEDRLGHFRAADKGTLFLDEIGDMPMEAQTHLLRVLETGQVTPVGASNAVTVDVRVVAATHYDLKARVEQGLFRRDLYTRLNGQTISILPLRERKEDIFQLTRRFLRRPDCPHLSPGERFITALLHYDFPGNVRELKNAVERAFLQGEGHVEDCNHLPPEIVACMPDFPRRGQRPSGAMNEARLEARRSHGTPVPGVEADDSGASKPSADELRHAMRVCNGNLRKVGDMFGRSRGTVDRWLRHYNIKRNIYRVPRGRR